MSKIDTTGLYHYLKISFEECISIICQGNYKRDDSGNVKDIKTIQDAVNSVLWCGDTYLLNTMDCCPNDKAALHRLQALIDNMDEIEKIISNIDCSAYEYCPKHFL